jgi:hypothetical protein
MAGSPATAAFAPRSAWKLGFHLPQALVFEAAESRHSQN